MWVLDASLALGWVLPDESSERARAFLRELPAGEELWVPALWWYEIANGLCAAHRRGRITASDRDRMLASFGSVPLQTDREQGSDFLLHLAALAAKSGLGV